MSNWTLINEHNQTLDNNLDIEKIILSHKSDYDFKLVGKNNYHISIIHMDFNKKELYARCEYEEPLHKGNHD